MPAKFRRRVVILAAFVLRLVEASAQQPPAGNTKELPQQPAASTSSSKHVVAPIAPDPNDALENTVLDDADAAHITYMDPHLALKYNHDRFEGGSTLDRTRVHWLQAFGPSKRLAAGIEVPFLYFNGGEMEPNANGIGDLTVEFRGMLGKGEKFEHVAGIEFTMPSASNDLLGAGQTVMRLAWGFSAQITSHTLLSGELGYNRAIHTQRSEPGVNYIEPELILTQALGKRVGVFLDWDTYEDFNRTQYILTLKAGLEIELDHKQKWSLTPYAQFPLTRSSQAAEFKNSLGVDLIYNF